MSRHYWPTEPGEYILECGDLPNQSWTLGFDGYWRCGSLQSRFTTDQMRADGILGVRTPFDEEAERAAFEAWYKSLHGEDHLRLSRHDNGMYVYGDTWSSWKAWLAAKRHERGL